MLEADEAVLLHGITETVRMTSTDGGPYRSAFYRRSSGEEGKKINFIFILERIWKGFGKASSVRPQKIKQCWMSSSEQYEILHSFTFLDSCVCFSAPP